MAPSTAKDLIEHLLCVDPAQRYTIDEFLDHPWCHAAPAPPPLPTPAAVPMDSPLLSAMRGGREYAKSPGVNALKEAFDVSYAVHRMEEEGARRRAYNGRGGAGQRGFLKGLNEDDEDDEELADNIGSKEERTQPQSRGRNAARSKGFELKMDGATLLGRRIQKEGPKSSPLAAKPMIASEPLIAPGSPMRY